MHQDGSNPIVAVAILYHVGSSREKPGKTGFAHFFEHMLFRSSEHVGKGEFFRKIDNLGGTFNGGTWKDGTIYYEVVPKDALEKILWMESDRMGFLINTVTGTALEREKDIVINERRQRVDNQPYGFTNDVTDKYLFGDGHPYSWQVIGSMDDVRSATLEDVKEFYDRYYGVNNATLVIAGDFEPEEVKRLVSKYFGEFQPRPRPEPLKPMPVKLTETRKYFHEDNFALLPELTLTFPAVESYHPDSYALDFLAELFSVGRKSPFYKELVKKRNLAPGASVTNFCSELTGKFIISVRAYEGVSLNEVYDALMESLREFEENGFRADDFQLVMNNLELSFYNAVSGLLNKSFQLAQSNVFGGDPSRLTEEIRLLKAVTVEDVIRVYNKYLKNAAFLATSFVPKGQPELALDGSVRAEVVEENVEEAGLQAADMEEDDEPFPRTATTFDRSVEPPLGGPLQFKVPKVHSHSFENGLYLFGIHKTDLPLVSLSIRIKGGQLADSMEKPGLARLTAYMVPEGTRNRTPEELEEAFMRLGANIAVECIRESTIIEANCLSRNFEAMLELIEEMLFEPRWDETELERIRQNTYGLITQHMMQPGIIASYVFNRRFFGDEHILARPLPGTLESVESITMEDLKEHYERTYSPSVSSVHIAGDIDPERAVKALERLGTEWKRKEVKLPEYKEPAALSKPELYFVDIPDAKQSFIRAGLQVMPRNHPDYYPAVFLNYLLGAGSGSRLFTILRLEKGYTYGAYSSFAARKSGSLFMINSSVQSMFTMESLALIREIVAGYGKQYSADDLETTRFAKVRAYAGKFETNSSLISMLEQISTYDLPTDYVKRKIEITGNLTLEEAKAVYARYFEPGNMIYVVVGDARTQLGRLKEAGLGEPVLVDLSGNPVQG